MRIYLLVEGSSVEPQVYPSWIRSVNPGLSRVRFLQDLVRDSYYLESGGGYPNYLGQIELAVENCMTTELIDRLVVAVDSEEMSRDEKASEVENRIRGAGMTKDYRVIVQHFCFETWALGNRRIAPRSPQSERLREYLKTFRVAEQDPELMPSYPREELNRAQFAYMYLRESLKEKGVLYSKSNATYIADERYSYLVRRRLEEQNHIRSFASFISAFQR